jgi:DNA-binding transcriptional LysR family regulator
MDLRRLGHFLAVADHGGFTRAAKAVFVSQPALSLAVRELEDELGTELFYRVGRQVRLTPAGRALLGPARQALRDVDTARAAVASVTGLLTGSLTLGSLPTLAADPLAGLVGRFRTAHPGVLVDLAAPEDTADLAGLLQTGECELGLAEGATLPAGLTTRELTRQRLLVILPPGTTQPAQLAVGELGSLPFIAAPRGTSSRRLLDEALTSVGLSPSIAVVTAQREAILPLVLAGAGAALLPEPLARVAARLGAVVSDPRPPITRSIVLAHRAGALAPAARRFLDLATSAHPETAAPA